MLVDGQYVTKSMLVPYATAGQCYFNVKPSSRRWRRYDLEVMKNGAFGGLHFSKADSVRPVDPTQIFRVAVYGDSITETVGTTISGNGYAYHLGRRLGNMNVDLWGIGMTSTGYYNPGTDPGNSTCKFIDHIDDLTHAQFDMVVFAGGTNEIGTPALTLQAAAIACWQAARLRCPNAIIVILGSFVSATNNAGSLAVEQTLKTAFDIWADPNSLWVPLCTATIPMQTGGSAAARFVGSASGNNLSVSSVTYGSLAIGQTLLGDPWLPGTSITGGSGSSWTISQAQTVASGTYATGRMSDGNYCLTMGGSTGVDDTHPCERGHDYFSQWLDAGLRAKINA
jgi:hypothetical protein